MTGTVTDSTGGVLPGVTVRQTTIGFQRQFGTTMAVEADYVYAQGRFEKDVLDNMNLKFDPATGANLDFRIRSNRLYPDWGVISMNVHTAKSAYHALVTGFTKRFSNRWQASATYTLSGMWSADTRPFSRLYLVPFPTAPDLGGEWGLSEDDQRHRAVFSGIWQVGRGFQLSGFHYLGTGIRESSNYGGDLRNTGSTFSGRPAPGRDDRATQFDHLSPDECDEPASAAKDSAAGPPGRCHRGSLQYLRPAELDHRHRGEHADPVHATHQRAVSFGGIRVPVDVLKHVESF